jgi:hypothetical protein
MTKTIASKKSVKKTATTSLKSAKAGNTKMTAEDMSYQTKNDVQTLQHAQTISNDPMRMRAAQMEAAVQMTSLSKVAKK